MSIAGLLTAAAGVAAAAAIVDLAESRRSKRKQTGVLIGMLVRVGLRLRPGRTPLSAAERLEAAGSPLNLSAVEFDAIKVALAVGAAAMTAPLLLSGSRVGIACFLVSLPAAYLLPELLLARVTKRRRCQIEGETPDLVVLLAIAMGAGLPLTRSFHEVGARRGGVLGHEFLLSARELELGEVRSDVFARLVRRTALPGVERLVAVFERADRHGAPVEPALNALALDARVERARQIRDAAAKATPKMQLVIALMLVPAALLVVAAVMVPRLMGM